MRHDRTAILAIAAMFLSLASCTHLKSLASKDLTPAQRTEIQESKTPYTRPLPFGTSFGFIGDMLAALQGDRPLRIAVEPIGKTIENPDLPVDITQLVLAGLNSISPLIQVCSTSGTQGGFVKPDIVLIGAITEYDRDVESTDNDINGEIGFGSGNWSTDLSSGWQHGKSYSRIGVTFNLKMFDTGVFVPNASTHSIVRMVVFAKMLQAGFYIGRSGATYTDRYTIGIGVSRSLQGIINYSIIELLGIYLKIPYWLAFDTEPDEELRESMLKSFKEQSPRKQICDIQRYLNSLGSKLVIDGQMGSHTRKAILEFEKARNLPAKGEPSPALYWEILKACGQKILARRMGTAKT